MRIHSPGVTDLYNYAGRDVGIINSRIELGV